jgi:ABC-type transporter Mla subunit MlaD
MAVGFTPVGFRLRSDWVGMTVRAVRDTLSTRTEPPEEGQRAAQLQAYTDAFIESAGSLDRLWRELQERLRFTGAPAAYVRDAVAVARATDEAARPALDELEKQLPDRRTDLAEVRNALDRIRREAADLEAVLEPPPVDLASVQAGLDEMARGEGVASGELLEKYLRNGDL